MIVDCWIFITKSIIKVTQRCYSWLNIHVFYQNPPGELFNKWSLDLLTVIFDRWIFITHTKGTQRFPFWMNCCYMFFKGSNFYLQITHFYDFIQAWTDVTHFFKVSLENFPQSEHLYGFIKMETLKFFQECSLTTLNLYHQHKKGNSSKYELTVIFDSWIFNTASNKMDTKLLFLIEFSCVLSKSKVNSSKYEWFLDLLSLTVESL